MAKKQTRRSISVSRTTYERLKAFCEANNISMSQLVETRVNDFLGNDVGSVTTIPIAPRPMHSPASAPSIGRSIAPNPPPIRPTETRPQSSSSTTHPAVHPVPMTSAAARFVVEPPPPIIKPKQETAAPKPAEKRPDQIFTF